MDYVGEGNILKFGKGKKNNSQNGRKGGGWAGRNGKRKLKVLACIHLLFSGGRHYGGKNLISFSTSQ